jgi:hypothetical protein
LFPAIAPIALLFVAGWNFAFPPRWRSSILTISVGTMIVASSLIPFVSLHPLYNPSREWQASQVEHSVEITYVEPETKKQIARLIGYNLSRPYIAPGEYIPLELCWEPLGHTHLPYVMFVQLLDLHQTDADSSPDVWGRRMTYPGLGSRPTDRWALQQAFCDTVLIQAFPDTPTPLGVAIEVGFFNPENESRLEIVDKENDPIALAHIGGISIISPQALSATRRAAPYIFDNAIGLEPIQFSGTPGRSITLTLTWQSLQSVSYDATVFIHLKGADGSTLAQVDREPLDGRFPTSYWFPGQIITDVISLPLARDLPNETLAVHVGMYTWPSLQRLPVIDAVGNPQRDNVIVTDWTSQRKTP